MLKILTNFIESLTYFNKTYFSKNVRQILLKMMRGLTKNVGQTLLKIMTSFTKTKKLRKMTELLTKFIKFTETFD